MAKVSGVWLTKEAAETIVAKFTIDEEARSKMQYRGTDLRTTTPFISGNGFRSHCPHICDETNRCRMVPESVKNGSCVFIKSDLFPFFAESVAPRIPGTYISVAHNGDLSTPDGQTDSGGRLPKYVVSHLLEQEYKAGRLLAHHGQNLWWRNMAIKSPRPAWAHCLPIGVENRQYPMGGNPQAYVDAIKQYIINAKPLTPEEDSKRPLLLIAFYPRSRSPDRLKVLYTIGAYTKDGKILQVSDPFYNLTDLSHKQWLEAIPLHRFVLAPFGHGLDTHRVSEILMMGGIPVMRRSTMSSCYDDTDNQLTVNGKTTNRGSLPVVVLDSWANLTKDMLEREWARISVIPKEQWDWTRLTMTHWMNRIDGKDTKNI